MSDSQVSRLTGVGLSAAIGGLVAVLVDLFQKGDASAVFEFTGMVNRAGQAIFPLLLGAGSTWPGIPVAGVGLGLVIFAIALAYIGEARTRSAAFYSGASVLTVLMTLVPYNTPLQPSGTTVNKMAAGDYFFQPVNAGSSLMGGRIWLAAAGDELPVSVIIRAPVGDQKQLDRINGRLYDAVSGKEWQLGYAEPARGQDKGSVTYRFDFVIKTAEPKDGAVADLQLWIDADGYQIATASQKVNNIAMPVALEIELKPTWQPRILKRILESPKF